MGAARYALAMTSRGPCLALLIAAAAALTACTAAPGAAPTPTPTAESPVAATEAPDTTTEPAGSGADAIVIGPLGIEVLDAGGGSLFAATYRDPLDDVVAGLETVLGAAPVEGTDPGNIERAPYDIYTWDGLRLGADPAPDVTFDVRATGDATGGVEVRTPEGVTIGTDTGTVRSTYPDTYESYPEFDIARGPAVVVDETLDPPRTFSVFVLLNAPATVVTRIAAPADSHGV